MKRAPAGSGRAPVALGTGAEAPAAAGCVGAAPVASGQIRWRRGGFGGVVLGLRVGAGREVDGHGLCLGGGAWRRRRHGDGVTAAACVDMVGCAR